MRGAKFSIFTLFAAISIAFASDEQKDAKIFAGKQAASEAHPWVVGLLRKGSSDPFDSHYAGGVLVSEHWVLTAGHSIQGFNPSALEVLLGAHRLQAGEGRRVGIAEVILHPDFSIDDHGNVHNDLALLRLAEPVTDLTPLSLASNPDVTPGTTAKVFGWGALSEAEGLFSRNLQSVDLLIAENDLFLTTPYLYLKNHHLAALPLNGAGDACRGDSGGPLVVYRNGVPKLGGIVSYGFACGTPDVPGIYAHVPKFASWIHGHLQQATVAKEESSYVRAHTVDLSGDWRFSEWLGYVNDRDYPWLYHDELGWLFVDEEGKSTKASEGVWLWDHQEGEWLWTATSEAGWFADRQGGQRYFEFNGAPTDVFSFTDGWYQR